MRNVILSTIFFALFISKSQASTPLWTFTPLTPTTVTVTILIPDHTVIYRLTNQSRTTHNLVWQPIPFTRQITVLPGDCQTVSTLGYLESCNLRILVEGSAFRESFRGGPVVCELGSQAQCYQPEENDVITVIYDINISASNKNLYFKQNETYKSLTITNTAKDKVARNIKVNIKDQKTKLVLSEDSSDCKEVYPGQSCTIHFSRQAMDNINLKGLQVKGDNTKSIELNIQTEN